MPILHFQMLARYNSLANRRLYEVCALLTDAERKQIRPAFFKSIHGTLNHLIIVDRIWMGRFAGQEMPWAGVDAILYDDYDELRRARVLEDEFIEAFIAGLDRDFLVGTITYENVKGTIYTDPVNLLVAHFFNHQTHHRGQIHDMLCQTEIDPPVLDLHRILRA
ncbi:DinB family protein [Cylindrospermum sp. FACHB-282]|uniref:DinB family protein n=1 Tax=Cylindrospermum sp. FACHB-282 TaxID=2692794 RepID=UPI00168800E6|nr:DinB family protein [Cylindrospermum sp. FACHB-282]MBD2387638.1 damage-inducible protein DinB [Cylindrospermum sp. FACHB-282]